MALIRLKLAQGCQATAAIYSHFVGLALDWIDFKVPSNCSIITETLDIALQFPDLKLISQVLRAIGNAFGQQSNAHIAQTCLPRLI
jgi:hypothetical protein